MSMISTEIEETEIIAETRTIPYIYNVTTMLSYSELKC